MRIPGTILAALIAMQACGPALAQEGARHLTVIGEGRVEAVPDMATLSLGVMVEADTAAGALSALAEATTGAMAALDKAGVAARDRQSSGLSLSPRWQDSRQNDTPPTINGYVAQTDVTVRVRVLDTLGDLLDAVVSDGANTLGGLSFGLAEPRAAEDDARKAAVADARAKAELYARAAGVTLGPVQSISELGGRGPGPVQMQMAEMARFSMPVASGEVEITAQVEVVFGIE